MRFRSSPWFVIFLVLISSGNGNSKTKAFTLIYQTKIIKFNLLALPISFYFPSLPSTKCLIRPWWSRIRILRMKALAYCAYISRYFWCREWFHLHIFLCKCWQSCRCSSSLHLWYTFKFRVIFLRNNNQLCLW